MPEKNSGILRAGIAKTDITPSLPVKLYGYSSRKVYSDGIHDPLSARAVAFENNGKKFIMVSTDLGSFYCDVFTVIQKTVLEKFNLKESEFFLTTIHSHSSPILALSNETGDPNNIEYTKELQQKLIKVISEAIKNMRPVQTGAGVLYDYATHSTSLGPANLKVSGDILGLSAQFVEKILGKDVITPVFAGASGNIDPWYRVLPGFNEEPGWIPEPVLLGTLLGEEVVHVFRNIKEVTPGGEISSASATVECPRKKTADNTSAPAQPQPETVPVNITVAHIGNDVAFVGFNVEMLTEIGMEIKKASPFKYTFVITHCNGYSGYLAPAELYKEGGYEVTSSRFEIGSSDMVVKKALRMLYDLNPDYQ